MTAPYIFDIKRTSTVDGPGVRTVIFFKGCNMDCFWCHNPEGKSPDPQLALFREKCIACGVCLSVCPAGIAPCRVCGTCAESCPTQARKLYGKRYSTDALMEIIKADLSYYQATGGGVTFSGGECMLYPEFLAELAEKCKKAGIQVAVDTAGNVPYASFQAVLPYVDLFLYDIKCLSPELHQKGTGVDNRLILDNLSRLQAEHRAIRIRTPVVPGFNAGNEVEKIRAYCAERSLPIELLEYHAFGEAKAKALSDALRSAF